MKRLLGRGQGHGDPGGPSSGHESRLLLQGGQGHLQQLAVFQKPGQAPLQFKGF